MDKFERVIFEIILLTIQERSLCKLPGTDRGIPLCQT